MSIKSTRFQLEATQWRNITKVVWALADFCFESKDHPKYGSCWLALVNSLTARDGLDITTLRLEPLQSSSENGFQKAFSKLPLSDAVVKEKARIWMQDGCSPRKYWNESSELAAKFAESMYAEGFRAAEKAHGIKE